MYFNNINYIVIKKTNTFIFYINNINSYTGIMICEVSITVDSDKLECNKVLTNLAIYQYIINNSFYLI